MKYRMGDVARIIGTSKEAIRYFEKMKCIKDPERTDAGYRVYNPLQLSVLRWFRLYRAYGFTMREAAELVNAREMETQRELLYLGIERLRREQHRLALCEQDLESFIEGIFFTEKKKREIQIEMCPALYRISYEYNEKMTISGEKGRALDAFTAHMPLVKYTVFFHNEHIFCNAEERADQCIMMDNGLGIFEKDICGWEPGKYSAVEVYPRRLCLTTYITSPVTYQTLKPIFEYIKRNDFELAGTIFSRPAEFHKEGKSDLPVITCKFYIPVRQKNT